MTGDLFDHPPGTKWRVTYPGLTQDLIRDFDNEADAKRFAAQRRNYTGRYALPNDWRHVRIDPIEPKESDA